MCPFADKGAQRFDFTPVGLLQYLLLPLGQRQIVVAENFIVMLRAVRGAGGQHQIVIGEINIIILQKIIGLPEGQDIAHGPPDSIDIGFLTPFIEQHVQFGIHCELPGQPLDFGHPAFKNFLAFLQLDYTVLNGKGLRYRDRCAVGHVAAYARNN
ncbi:hypothetical protein D3C75_886680 [compost metagenome]